jgi:hypothetical protein
VDPNPGRLDLMVRVRVGAVLAVTCLATGCLTTGCGPGGGLAGARRPPSTAPTGRPSPRPTVTVVRTGQTVQAGTTAIFRAQAGVSLSLRASVPSVSRRRLSRSYGYAPARGYYVTFAVTVVNTGTLPVNLGPADFFVQVRGEGRVTTVMGNAPYSGASAQLDTTQLSPGERLTGPVTFDVRRPSGTLAYAPDGSPAISWSY